MSKLFNLLIINFILSSTQVSYSQEWKNMKEYKKSTNQTELQEGCWLKKDRKKETEVWKQANLFNISSDSGYLNYKTICEKRDFYLWFDAERIEKGHEINMIGVVGLVAGQLSKFDSFFISKIVIHNKEVVWFGHEGSDKVLEFAFPLLRDVYFSKDLLKGQEAKAWDLQFEKREQCDVVEAVYNQLTDKAFRKLERIAKGKGIYNLAVKKEIKFEGELTKCNLRYEYAITKLMKYYIENKHKK